MTGQLHERDWQVWWDAPADHVQTARQSIIDSGADDTVVRAALVHLAAPALTARSVAAAAGVPAGTVEQAYRLCRDDSTVRSFTASACYAHRLWYQAAAVLAARWQADSSLPARLLAGQPVPPDTVEIHPSRGTCAYGCAMCLWSDKDTLTYATRDLRADGLLTLGQWTGLLDQLRRLGAGRLVVSGGGEALLNPDLPAILGHAGHLGFSTSLYTTGFNLDAHRGALWGPVAGLAAVRLSIHSPDPATYAHIVRLPERVQAFDRVTDHVRHLLNLRAERGTGPRLGIGFVLQPGNHGQIEAMADYAASVGVDHLDLRKDEVDVTDGLTPAELAAAAAQLRRVRERAADGAYGRLEVDLGDELVALANGQPVARSRSSECRIKYLRPTISPYGVLAPCDLKAEPRFADSAFNLGVITRQPIAELVDTLPDRPIADACDQCMPSSRTGNSAADKLLTDLRDGLPLNGQPFATTATPALSTTETVHPTGASGTSGRGR